MNRAQPKPPDFHSRPVGGTGRTPPPLSGGSLAVGGMSLGTRIGLGIAIGLFSTIAIVIVGAVAVKVMNRPPDVVAKDAAAAHRSSGLLVAEETDPAREAEPSPIVTTPEPEREDPDPLGSLSDEARQNIEQAKRDEQQRIEDERKAELEAARAAEEASPSEDPDRSTKNLKEVADWLANLDGKTLALPKPATLGTSSRVSKFVELPDAMKEVPDGDARDKQIPAVSLKLLGCEVVFGEAEAVTMERIEVERQSREGTDWDENLVQAQWAIRSNAREGGTALGNFAIRDGWLTFDWSQGGAKSKAGTLLKFCLLEVSSIGEATQRKRAVCRLGMPTEAKLVAVNLLLPNQTIELPFHQDDLPPSDQLQMDVVFYDFPRHKKETEEGIDLDEVLVTEFFVDEQVDEEKPALEIAARFDFENRPIVSFEVAVHPDRLIAEIEETGKVTFEARASKKLRTERKKRLQVLQKQKREFEAAIVQTNRFLIEVVVRLRKASIQDRNRLEQRQQFLQNQLPMIRKALANNAKEVLQFELEDKWRRQATILLTSLRTKGRIGLRLLIKIDDERVIIAAPKSD